ncbi:Uncharacterised protein [Serratia fonticola]|uniref:hypothetical protein n=1 Tax=Serratia fonticola TaxID=47917 RepID=UPI002178C309|nr:hypothetical protein [Serratia fonticola]CAI1992088.1 Uncharacterised protein [Serratia fonticola]
MNVNFCHYYLFDTFLVSAKSGSSLRPDTETLTCNQIGFILESSNNHAIVNQIASSTSEIIGAVTTSNNSGLGSAITVAFIGAASAFLFNLLQQHRERKISKIESLVTATLDLIVGLESVSTKYWITGYSRDRKEQISIDEARIKSINKMVRKHIDLYVNQLSGKQREENESKLTSFVSSIFDETTGGDFSSLQRRPSNNRVVRISDQCLEAISIIKATSLK